MVALANPLDYHTYIWRDEGGAMTAAWSGMVDPDLALTMIILDYPRADRCDATDWDIATNAALNVRTKTGGNVAVVASLPELMSEATCERLMAGGVVPILGLDEAVLAAEAAAKWRRSRLSRFACPARNAKGGRSYTKPKRKPPWVPTGWTFPRPKQGLTQLNLRRLWVILWC